MLPSLSPNCTPLPVEEFDVSVLEETSIITRRGESVSGVEGCLAETPSLTGREMIVPRDCVIPYPDQPRQYFPDKEIEELSVELKSSGQFMPMVVVPYWHEQSQSLKFMIVDGEMRYRASGLAGMNQLKVIVHTHLTEADLYKAAASTHKDSTKMQRTDRILMLARLYNLELEERPSLAVNEYATEIDEGYNNIHDGLRIMQLAPEILKCGVAQQMPCMALIYLANRKKALEKDGKEFPEQQLITFTSAALARLEGSGQRPYLGTPQIKEIFQRALIVSGSGEEAMRIAFSTKFELALQYLRSARKRGEDLFDLVDDDDATDPALVKLFAGMSPRGLEEIAEVVKALRAQLDSFDSLISWGKKEHS